MKDYAKSLTDSAETQEIIEKTQLGNVIDDYIKDPRVQRVAKRSVWIGNDETHYLRKWVLHDLDDLEKLITMTIDFIEMERLANEYVGDMDPDATTKK